MSEGLRILFSRRFWRAFRDYWRPEAVAAHRAWAARRRNELCSRVRFWFWLWYVYGDAPRAVGELITLSDHVIWDHWRDFNEINKLLLGRDHPASPLDVAETLAELTET